MAKRLVAVACQLAKFDNLKNPRTFIGTPHIDVVDPRRLRLELHQLRVGILNLLLGALTLYLDFINLFLMLLRLMGDRR